MFYITPMPVPQRFSGNSLWHTFFLYILRAPVSGNGEKSVAFVVIHSAMQPPKEWCATGNPADAMFYGTANHLICKQNAKEKNETIILFSR